MLQRVSIILELPVNGTGSDYVGAIAKAIDQATCRGDFNGSDALTGLLAVLRLSAEANSTSLPPASQNFWAPPRPF